MQYKKIQIGQLALDGANDSDLPLARVYAGEAQVPNRPGLLFYPIAVTCSYDGTILILEDTKSDSSAQQVLARIQAFDLLGNPVNRFFDSSGNPSPFLNLSTTGDNTYLDVAAVGDQTADLHLRAVLHRGRIVGVGLPHVHLPIRGHGAEPEPAGDDG